MSPLKAWLFLGGACAGTILAPVVLAQCPDGTPPPCNRPATVALTSRRPDPPRDDRTWIVVPFFNVTHATDSDWLTDASVNLLYLDMSRWRDIRVIDDERVADLIRAVPEARANAQLTLQSALAVARHAGAGWLVMGDVLRVGNRTELVGKIFDVRSGQRLRTVRQVVTQPDSIMAAFNRLARAVLNVDPPPGSSLGGVGTTSIQAYQAYVLGVGYLNQWSLDSAQAQFGKALELDSLFALAHYKLALLYGWESNLAPGEEATHAAHALALAATLPPRERSLVTGYAHLVAHRFAEACEIFERLVATDSTDVEAWFQLGQCKFEDDVVLPLPGDSSRFVFRSSWNDMLRAFRRTLELDPSYHLAFQPIQGALLSNTRRGCRLRPNQNTCGPNTKVYQAVPLRDHDTLVTIPVLAVTSNAELSAQIAEGQRTRARWQNLLEARRAAEAWLAAGPAESRPLAAYLSILLRMGDLHTADSISHLLPPGTIVGASLLVVLAEQVELNLKLGHVAAAARLVDSMTTLNVPSSPWIGPIVNSMLGRTTKLAPTVRSLLQTPDWATQYIIQVMRGAVGAPIDSLFETENVFSQRFAALMGNDAAVAALAGSLAWIEFAERKGSWPITDTASSNPRVFLASILATNDTARFRVALARFDSIATARHDEPEMGSALLGARAHLVIADTTGALSYLRTFRDVTWAYSPALDQIDSGVMVFEGMLWPRTLLLLADLAAATGQREEAAGAYRLFIAMWEHGDPEVQPVVQRARTALAGLQG